MRIIKIITIPYHDKTKWFRWFKDDCCVFDIAFLNVTAIKIK